MSRSHCRPSLREGIFLLLEHFSRHGSKANTIPSRSEGRQWPTLRIGMLATGSCGLVVLLRSSWEAALAACRRRIREHTRFVGRSGLRPRLEDVRPV